MLDYEDFPNPEDVEPNKLQFTYRITKKNYELLEEIAEEMDTTKNNVLDTALHIFAKKVL